MSWPERLQLALLPGMDGTGLMLQSFQEILAAEVPVTVVRYPARQRRNFAELVVDAYEQLPKGVPLVLLGESFSGPVAVTLARHFRLEVRGLILCATFARAPRSILPWVLPLLPTRSLLRIEPPERLVRYFCLGQDAPPLVMERFRETLKAVDPRVLAQRLEILSRVDVTADLPHLSMPVLYIQAARDRLVPERALLPFSQAIHQLVVSRVDGPHFLLEAAPQEAEAAVMDFVRVLPAS